MADSLVPIQSLTQTYKMLPKSNKCMQQQKLFYLKIHGKSTPVKTIRKKLLKKTPQAYPWVGGVRGYCPEELNWEHLCKDTEWESPKWESDQMDRERKVEDLTSETEPWK